MGSVRRYHAELIEDGGRSVAGTEFFRSAPYFAAEQVTHTLLIQGDRASLRVPLLVRPIPGTALADATSPYGYPGGGLEGPEPIDPEQVDWSEVPLVSLFVRDRIGPATCFTGGTLRTQSWVVDVSKPLVLRTDHLRQTRRNRRAGFRTEQFPGPASSRNARDAFHHAYTQTMERQHAAERYYFSREWVDLVLESPASFLVVCWAPDGEPAAANLVVRSDGYLHSFLGGSFESYRDAAPSKNTMLEKIALAQSMRLPLHLGAGLKPDDGLERFKRGFANATSPFYTHEILCDPDAYQDLSQGVAAGGFFPAYRFPHERAVRHAPAPASEQAAHA